MNKNLKTALLGAACTAAGVAAIANELPTGNLNPAYFPSNVQAQLQVGITPGTEAVHFVRDTSDSKIITKTYVLKNANPYEIRPYLRNMVQTMRTNPNVFNGAGNKAVSANPVNFTTTSSAIPLSHYYNQYLRAPAGVECMVFMDGTALLIISAEEYRFKDNTNGMGIDSIVAKLDAKGIKNSSGQPKFVYFPKNRPASELKTMVEAVGANLSNDTVELIGGKDKVRDDKDLNVLFFNTALYSRKNIEAMLKLYDVPHPQVRIRYTVYELMAENDGKIGADFQAWKNNEGANLFSMGGTYRDNWSATYAGGMVRNGKNNYAQFINFNPKWNTRYIDFLTSIGKAKVAYTGELCIRNNTPATLERKTQLFYVDTSKSAASGTLEGLGPYELLSALIGKIEESADQIPVGRGELQIVEKFTGFGFSMKVENASVNLLETRFRISLSNSSLLGFESNGTPRISSNSVVTQEVSLPHGTNSFVIGGLKKQEVVKSATGIPWLMDIPYLGYLFSSVSSSTKHSELVLVAQCEWDAPTDAPDQPAMSKPYKLHKQTTGNTTP